MSHTADGVRVLRSVLAHILWGIRVSLRNRALTAAVAAVLAGSPTLATVVSSAEATAPAAAAAPPEVPTGFQDVEAIPGLSEPVALAFAPDGTAFVALKTGVIKSFDYNAGTGAFEPWATHTIFANLDVNVENYWDRGLTGITLDPQFGAAGHNFVFVNYTYNRDPRTPGVVPKWGDGSSQYDDCPAPAAMASGSNPAVSGCITDFRVSRLAAVKGAQGWVMSGAEQPLVDLPMGQSACFQFGSHASGDVIIAPDGMLYASAGDGASFDTEDWGQANNPCADPANEGGGLRSQDIRTSGDPLGLGGTIFRVNPNGGQVASGAQANAARIVTYGQRNPWRLAIRPGTSELWSADVGASTWEEVNRTDLATFSAPVNLGWPCYEGAFTGIQKQAGWDALDKPVCENLYAAEAATPGTVRPPYFSYRTRGAGLLTPHEHCQQGTSSISGVAFVPTTSSYPAQYRGAMFFNDFARSCVWFLTKKSNGDPDPTQINPFVQNAESPVSIEVGPGGDLFYVDYGIEGGNVVAGAGAIHRIKYTPANQAPVAHLTASAPSGPQLLTVAFDASTSTDADGDPLTYEWALDGDGVFNDGGGATTAKTYATAGPRTVQVRVSDGRGGSDTEQLLVTPGNTAPTIATVSPTSSLTWSVGQTVAFSATATDAQQTLPDSAYKWSLVIEHCPSVCHTHGLTGFTGRSGSFPAPDHEYPSDLLLTLTVTDDQGLTDTRTVKLDPRSVAMTFASSPTGAALTVSGAGVFAPHAQTFIQGTNFNVTAPDSREVNGAVYQFASWSDGGARSHAVVAPTTPTTLTATYARQNRPPVLTVGANPTSGTVPLTVSYTAGATDPDGDNTGFTYEWALDGDGLFNDGGGTTKSKQFTTVGAKTVQVRVTDSHGGQDTESVVVNVGAANQPPVAALTATPTSGPAPLAVSFNAGGSTDPDGDALIFEWALDPDGLFNDGSGATKSRTFSSPGTYAVSVRVSDGRGGTSTKSTSVTSGNRLPTVSLAANPTTGTAPLSATFTATAADPDGTALTYKWDLDDDGQLDDGGIASTQAASFSAVGAHQVTVEVTDADGGKATAARTVTVTNRGPDGIVYSSPGDPGPAPLTTTFHAVFTDPDGGPLTYAWDLDDDGQFDDGGTAAIQTATLTKVGVNRVYVRGTDADGGSWVAFATITVLNRNPVVTLAASPEAGPAPLSTTFTATASDPDATALSYAWDTDDDGTFETPTGSTPTLARTFDTAGSHVVEVKVTDADSGTATASATVTSTTVSVDEPGTSPAPVRQRVVFRAKPGFLKVKVSGKARRSGYSRAYDVGTVIKVIAPKKQWRRGVRYEFVRWSDGRGRTHKIVVPDQALRLKAVYRRTSPRHT